MIEVTKTDLNGVDELHKDGVANITHELAPLALLVVGGGPSTKIPNELLRKSWSFELRGQVAPLLPLNKKRDRLCVIQPMLEWEDTFQLLMSVRSY